MIYIYRSEASAGALELARALDGRKLLGHVGGRRFTRRVAGATREVTLAEGDVVVCWGSSLGTIPGIRVLNGAALQNKYEDALKLKEAGVSTIEVSRTRPTTTQQRGPAPQDPARVLYTSLVDLIEEFEGSFSRSAPFATGVGQLRDGFTSLATALRTPAPVAPPSAPQGEWLGRDRNHVGGSDLLVPTTSPDFYVKKETFAHEYRVHSFDGLSIRAGVKAPRPDFPSPHAWVRSWDGGWRIQYDGVSSKQRHREIAHAAVTALGLTFGAVDIGERADRSLVVLEVNRAPGVENGTVDAYAEAITRWVTGATPVRRAA